MKNSLTPLVIQNIAYQYLDEQRTQSTYKQLAVLMRDLFSIERHLAQFAVEKDIIVMTDTDAAGIRDYIMTIRNCSRLPIATLIVDKRQSMCIMTLLTLSLWIIRQVGSIALFNWKLWVDYRKSPLPLVQVLLSRYFSRNECLSSAIFGGRRCIVFYEKSILSMMGYLYSGRFEVMQHGNPTETYWPSLAEVYYAWSVGYRDLIAAKCAGQIRISGYPGQAESAVKFKVAKFDILFLSQYGSSQELIDECRQVKQYINHLSARGLRIVVKPHPRESADDLQFAPGIAIAEPNDKMEDLFSICTSVCSYYSTALLLAAHRKCAVFRITLGARSVVKDFPFLKSIPAISATDTQTNPLTIAKRITTDIQEFDCHVLV